MEGERLSHYEILERLGGGGMGVVYKALDTKLNRHVALKFLPPELTRDDEARTRFIQEAQAASALDHPNICTIHEIDSTPEGQMFIAMAFCDGATLKKRIEQGPLLIDEALDIAIQVAQGLVKAHQAGIVHRDIKPANVMLTKDGFVKIVDFGIAKLLGVTGPTKVGSTLGTVAYMSPEQVAGEDVDPRTDVWALGAVLYEMLTGQLPGDPTAILPVDSPRGPCPEPPYPHLHSTHYGRGIETGDGEDVLHGGHARCGVRRCAASGDGGHLRRDLLRRLPAHPRDRSADGVGRLCPQGPADGSEAGDGPGRGGSGHWPGRRVADEFGDDLAALWCERYRPADLCVGRSGPVLRGGDRQLASGPASCRSGPVHGVTSGVKAAPDQRS